MNQTKNTPQKIPTTITHATVEELQQQHQQTLNKIGLTLEQITHMANNSAMGPREWAAWNTLKEIAFLLGEPQ